MPSLTLPSGQIYFSHRHPHATKALILIHGAGGHHQLWPKEIKNISDYNTYALDLPGHGRSLGEGCTSIQDYADGVQEFILHQHLQEFVLCGHSMGGAIVLELAKRKLPGLQKIVLLGTGAKLSVHPKLIDLLRSDPDAAIQRLIRLLYGENAPPLLVQEATRDLGRLSPKTLLGDFLACDAFDLREDLGSVKIPALILVGENDPMTPPALAKDLAFRLENSTLQILSHSGHMIFLNSKPMALFCVQLIQHFLYSRGTL